MSELTLDEAIVLLQKHSKDEHVSNKSKYKTDSINNDKAYLLWHYSKDGKTLY